VRDDPLIHYGAPLPSPFILSVLLVLLAASPLGWNITLPYFVSSE
jgi:hypothetical protein